MRGLGTNTASGGGGAACRMTEGKTQDETTTLSLYWAKTYKRCGAPAIRRARRGRTIVCM